MYLTKICNTWLKSRSSITYWYCALPCRIVGLFLTKELIYCDSKSHIKGIDGSLCLLCSKSIQNIYSKLFQHLLAFFLVISLNIQLLMDNKLYNFIFFGGGGGEEIQPRTFKNLFVLLIIVQLIIVN